MDNPQPRKEEETTPAVEPVVVNDDVKPVVVNDNAPENTAPPANNNGPATCGFSETPEVIKCPVEQKCPVGKGKKVLSAIFNMAVGAGLTALAKAAITSAMIGCPPLCLLLATSLAVGFVAAGLCHEGKRRKAKKENGNAPCFFSRKNAKDFFNKQNAKVFARSSFFALVGGAIFLGFHEGVFQNAWHSVFGQADLPPAPVAVTPAVAPPPVDVTPPDVAPAVTPPVDVPLPCPTPAESFAGLIDGHAVSDRVQDALQRAASTDPRVAAQGTKDLAYFAFNGFDGVPKDSTVALQLFQQAADAGNTQARVDLLYMQYHGLGGVTANPHAAFEAMQNISMDGHAPRAATFVEAWAKNHIHDTARMDFDSKAILQGVKFCPGAA